MFCFLPFRLIYLLYAILYDTDNATSLNVGMGGVAEFACALIANMKIGCLWFLSFKKYCYFQVLFISSMIGL